MLGEDDIHDVYREVFSQKENYFMLGMGLGLPLQELKKIETGYPQDLARAFNEMLQVWLKQSYNIDRHGPPTWRRLVEVVDDPAGGNNHALAKKIASNHPKGMYMHLFSFLTSYCVTKNVNAEVTYFSS